MNSIRRKIQSALIGSILVIGIFAAAVIFVNELLAQKNQHVIETMTKEYNIISLTDNLILKFNDVVKSSGDATAITEYNSLKNTLLSNIASLKVQISSHESRTTLVGVENTVNKVLSSTDTGIDEMKKNNLPDFSDYFSEANKQNVFVKDNVQTLLQKELEYLSANQADTQHTTRTILAISGGLLALLIVIMLFLASSFSRQLVLPIEKLSDTARRVAAGDIDIKIDQILLDQQDEVGILSNSFVNMVTTIKSKINELSSSNSQLEASKAALEKGNKQLEKFNSLMVGRELKMVELKEKIAQLEG